MDNLRSKPPVDETIVAERQAVRLKREAAEAKRRAAKMVAGRLLERLKPRRRRQSSRPFRRLLQKRRRGLRATLVVLLGRIASSIQHISRWAE